MTKPLLALHNVSLSFKGVKALTNLSFTVQAGQVCALIGPNGAGKSSALNIVNGVYRADSGRIVFDGTRFERIRPLKAARLGIGRTFQHNALFKHMSVLDNVMAGLTRHTRTGPLSHAFHLPRGRREEARMRERAEQVLDFLHIRPHRDAAAGTLPYGVQKRVDLARALVAKPKLILLDEPMAGMNQDEKEEMSGFIRHTNRTLGTTMLLIEHDVGVVMDLSDQVVVLDYGRKVGDGSPEAVRNDPEVIAAYLGTVH
ncbi:ABC transporter ATP-binding protein [Acidisoma sp. L85]|uniref:ABC transporter ATP-binding protein n=1 Tax=Acidisoma sp. L85 TaxID=1641850 RepID=UPI00131C64D7|nr:ABC transporter ATP-binding protein [Acidisoma sp. L85]